MEPQDNKQIALSKAISSHEQAAAALTDLMAGTSEERYGALMERIQANLADLQAAAAESLPGDHV